MKDLFWDCFTETGNIELYLQYKKYQRRQELKNAERNDKNKGSCGENCEQRR